MQSGELEEGSVDDTQQYETDESPINDDTAGSRSAVILRSRKRIRRCDGWKKNIPKMKRTTGEKYTSNSTNKGVREMCVQPTNCSKCSIKCSNKISAETNNLSGVLQTVPLGNSDGILHTVYNAVGVTSVGVIGEFGPTGVYGRITIRDPDHHTCSRNELGASEEGGPESGMADQNPRSRPPHLFSNDRVH